MGSNVKPDPTTSGHVENRDGTRVQNHVWILTPKKIRPNVACKCHHHHRRTWSGTFQELNASLLPRAPSLSAPWSVAFVREGSDLGCATIRLISRALGDTDRHLWKGETCAKARRRSEYNHVDPRVSREARRGGEAHETRRDPAHHSPNSNDARHHRKDFITILHLSKEPLCLHGLSFEHRCCQATQSICKELATMTEQRMLVGRCALQVAHDPHKGRCCNLQQMLVFSIVDECFATHTHTTITDLNLSLPKKIA